MQQIIIGTVVIGAGTAAIVFRKKFVNDIVKLNKEGVSLYRYGKKEIRLLQVLTPLFGLVFVILGVLILFSVIEFKQP